MSITLIAGATNYAGWKSISVTASLKNAARDFTATVSEISDSSLISAFWIAPGTPVAILVDGQPVLTGFVNKYEPSIDANSHSVTISGRSSSQDAVDSSAMHETGRFEDMTTVEIANQLSGEVGISTITDQAVTKLKKFQLDVGETIFSAIDRLARIDGLSVTGTADGNMMMTKAGPGFYAGYLGEGSPPLLSIRATIEDTKKFSSYEMRSQLAGYQNQYGTDSNEQVSRVKDGTVKRNRPKVMISETAADSQSNQKRAQWQAVRIAGDQVKVSAICQGHRFNGQLWEPNKRIFVLSPAMKLAHTLLVERVTWTQDEGGEKTRLELVPPSSYEGETSRNNAGSKTAAPASIEASGTNAPRGGASSGSQAGSSAFDGSTPEVDITPPAAITASPGLAI